VTIVSNSDSHSPQKLGREATVIDCNLSYKEIIDAIKTNDDRLVGTIEFFPQEGKYHFDGHRLCGVRMSPQETKQHNAICPKCGKPMVVGVDYRVDEIADRPESYKPQNHKQVEYIIPLPEIIAEMKGVSASSKKVTREYEQVYSTLGDEFSILRSIPTEEIKRNGFAELAQLIDRMRKGDVQIEPGYDGVYGIIKLFSQQSERIELTDQMSLGI
jgi:PHP family Zn ribbon phosphoesterase